MSRRAIAVLAAGALLAGCSSNPPPESGDTSPAPARHGGLAECLKSQGVQDAGGPAAVLGPPTGVDQATWDEAMRACSSLAPGPAAP